MKLQLGFEVLLKLFASTSSLKNPNLINVLDRLLCQVRANPEALPEPGNGISKTDTLKK